MPYKRGDKWVTQVRKNAKRKEAIFRTEKEEADWRRKPVEGREELETPTGSYLIDWAEEYLNFAKVKFTVKVYDEKRFIFKRFFGARRSGDAGVCDDTPNSSELPASADHGEIRLCRQQGTEESFGGLELGD